MEDYEILALLLRRDAAAVDAMQEKYSALLRALAGRILYDARDAEECVNDALLQAWHVIPPQQPRSLPAFLSVLVRQGALDRRRRQTAEKRGGTEYDLSLDELADCVGGKEADLSLDELALTQAIEGYLCTISPTMRSAFVRRYFAAESVAEIAEALHCSQSKVKSMLLRTRNGLRSYLEKEGFDL